MLSANLSPPKKPLARTYWSKSKKRDNAIAFFDHCVAQKWIRTTLDKDRGNPARGMARIVGKKDSSIPRCPLLPRNFKLCCEPAPLMTFRWRRSTSWKFGTKEGGCMRCAT
jgi:hypothetical protein